MIVVDYKPEHALRIRVQKAQQEVVLTPEYAQSLAQGPAMTGLVGDDPMFCIGKQMIWEGRWIVWGLLSEDAHEHMLAITRIARRMVALQRGRHEMIVRTGFKQGDRWARILGFTWHHHEERFLPNGKDAEIYVRHC